MYQPGQPYNTPPPKKSSAKPIIIIVAAIVSLMLLCCCGAIGIEVYSCVESSCIVG